MDNLKVTLIQTSLFWEDAETNRQHFSKLINGISEATDLVVLPEMFTTGFSMNARDFAESVEGSTLFWMKDIAARKDVAVTGSVMVEEDGKYFNRLYFVFPDGSYGMYDKRHAFTLAGEQKVYTVGNEKLVVEYKGWKISPLICYDLRFPVWSRNKEGYDVLIYVANWPAKRISAWDILLKARAIENMSFCIGVNRIGMDGNGHDYIGHSAAYDALGVQMSNVDWENELIQTITLNKKELSDHRDHLQFLNDRDDFTLA
jgi:omega-amidase